jgi:hypothetical protein
MDFNMIKKVKIYHWLIIACIGIAILFVVISLFKGNLTTTENILFQILMLGCGLTGSYYFGRNAAKQSAQDVIKPHAKSAFRRVLSLYYSLSRLAHKIEEYKIKYKDDSDKETTKHVLEVLENMVIEQISTADDALEDWKDIVPEEVKMIIKDKKGGKDE